MLSKKVNRYEHFDLMGSNNIVIAIMVEMIKEFGLIKKNNYVFYSKLNNKLYDLDNNKTD